MQTKLAPAIKGLITGILMLIFAFSLYYTDKKGDSPLQYLAYVLYAGGIIWTLMEYRRSPSFKGTFGGLFGQGFRCFITVTLVMVTFTGGFSAAHPEFAQEAGENYRKELVKQKAKTTTEIDELVATAKKQYTVQLISMSIFGYLIVGAAITAATSLLLTKRTP